MSDLDDVADAVSAGIAAIDTARQTALHAAQGFADTAATVAQQTVGSAIADLPGVYLLAGAEVERQAQAIGATAEGLRRYLDRIGKGQSPTGAQGNPHTQGRPDGGRPGVHTTTPASTAPTPVPEARVAALRRALPPPVQPRDGTKTHGQWVAGSGNGPAGHIKSGRDEMETAAVEFFTSQGARRMPNTTADVEVKLAVHMSNNGIKHATVAVNNQVCQGPFGCDTLLPKILPEGSTLTVYGTMPDGQPTGSTYLGRRKTS
ncbi:DddA-like double-stranded DNA deaminase toxin [Amycolatopsis sp. NPDC098790]|uniref:DddA-like double-stranded DNA deaminase toxin n=1 Tax=Amycolatopsis sp. NPDC098790 TaxID=3363939 RepID=UPI0037F57095